MKSLHFEVGQYTSSVAKVPGVLKGTFYTKWSGKLHLLGKKKKPMFNVELGTVFGFVLVLDNKVWLKQNVTITKGDHVTHVHLPENKGQIYIYQTKGKVTEIIAHLKGLQVQTEHKIICVVDDDEEMCVSLGRAQKIATNKKFQRVYTWSAKSPRASYSEYDWHPSSESIKALVSTRTLKTRRASSVGDRDDCINRKQMLPLMFDCSKSLFVRFDNHKFSPPKCVYANFTFENTEGTVTTRIADSDMVVTVYYDQAIYSIILVVPDYADALNFKKRSKYNTK